LVVILGLAAFSVGAGCLALALYMWFGAWPQSLRETLDYYRSVAATEGRPPPPLLGNVRARAPRSLAGSWNALVDPLLLGESAISAGMIPRNVRAQAPSDLIEFSFEGGLALEVPGDWNTQHDRLFFYEGPIWYQRVFEHRRDPERRVFLWFGAANYRASVFVNGRRVGGHEGGFTPFNFEIGELLRDGENLLVVMVDNTHTPEDIPVRRHDWLNYGGLTRDVLLLDLPATFIRNYAVELDPGDGQRIRGWVQLDGDRLRQDVMIAIPELGAEATVTSDADGRARFELAATPERWSPRSPKLYRIELRSETDAVSDGIGFRSVTVRGRDLLLNGETIFLRGISIHEEKPGPDGGRAHSEAHAEALLGWAQELGCNFVRLAHYTHNEHMVRLADRLGLLVWAEIPVYWNVAFDEPRTLERARTQLSEMIARDRNRASVILWSIGNETPVSDERNAFMKALADHVRALDATRPITAALLAGPRDVGRWALRDVLPSAAGLGRERWEYRVGDPLGAIVDVAALNEYFGWYYATPLAAATPLTSDEARRLILEHLPGLRLHTGLDKPLIVSEFGAGALAGRHAPEDELAVFSEEYQALVYRQQLAMLSQQSDLRGLSPWVLKDFRSLLRLHPTIQGHWNRKGLLSGTGQRKLAFEVLRQHYRSLAAGTPAAAGE
jgi:beta-glucuronidase